MKFIWPYDESDRLCAKCGYMVHSPEDAALTIKENSVVLVHKYNCAYGVEAHIE